MKKWYQKLREARIQKGWSQQKLAEQVGAQPITVSRWERGVTAPSLYFRQRLCEVFELSAQDLFPPEPELAAEGAIPLEPNDPASTPSPEPELAEQRAIPLEPNDPASTPPPEPELAAEGAIPLEPNDPASTPPPEPELAAGQTTHNHLPQSPLRRGAMLLGVLFLLLGIVAIVRYVVSLPPAAPTPTAPTALLETSTRLVAFASGRLRWSFSGHFLPQSQPLVDQTGGLVFALGNCDSKARTGDCKLHAVHLADGSKAWEWAYPSQFDFSQSVPGALAWTVGNGTLYLGVDADLYVLRVSDGTLLWHWTAPPYADRKIAFLGINSQLIPTQGGIYAIVPAGVFLLSQQDGKPMAHTDAPPWKCDPQGGVGGLLDTGNKQLVVADCNDLFGLSADQLKQSWGVQLHWQSIVPPQTALVNDQIVAWYGNTGAQFGVFVLPATGAQGTIQPTLTVDAISQSLLLDSGTGRTLLYGLAPPASQGQQNRLVAISLGGGQPQYYTFPFPNGQPQQGQGLEQIYDLSGGVVRFLVFVTPLTTTSSFQDEIFDLRGNKLKYDSTLAANICPVGQVALTQDGAYCASATGRQTALALLDPSTGRVTSRPPPFDGDFIALVPVQ